jgi:cytochrome c5
MVKKAPDFEHTVAPGRHHGKEGGLTTSATIQGIEVMPSKGTCEGCTPSEIETAICFMVNIKNS